MIAALVLTFHVLGFLSSVHAVMTTRTEQGAIAWAISLNTIPYVAVPAYWILGRSRFQGYVTSRRGEDATLRPVAKGAADEVRDYIMDVAEVQQPRVALAAKKLAEIPYLRGNGVELLIDGEATFASILDGIARARESVLFQFFIVHDDEIGRAVQAALIERAKAGVRVWFLYDEVGSHKLPRRYLDELRAAGVRVSAFNARKGLMNQFQLNFRNHRKIVVVDGREAWIGGHNVGDEYLGKDPKFGRWRDTHVRIEGPAALAAQLSFVEDWNWATDEIPDLSWTPRTSADADIPVLILPTGPADELETANLMFVQAIEAAQERIWIASPYFVPDRPIVTALQLAGLRGVDVRILIPDMPDHLLVYLAAFSYFEPAGATGVRFFRYTDGFLHEKAVLLDDRAGAVGTANFDNRSFRLNFEVTAVIQDSAFAREMEAMFEADFANAREVDRFELQKRPWWFRFAVRLAALTSPIQ